MMIRIRKPDLLPDVPPAPQRKRRRVGGRDVVIKNTHSAKNGKPKKLVVSGHGRALRKLLRDPLDLRSQVGKAHQAYMQELGAHVGGDLTVPQRRLIDQAARLKLVAEIAWGEIVREGAFRNGEPRPALDCFRRIAADERSVLTTLGIERVAKKVPSLGELLGRPGASNADQG